MVFQLFVKTLEGVTHTVDISDETLSAFAMDTAIKTQLALPSVMGVHPSKIRLIIYGKLMTDFIVPSDTSMFRVLSKTACVHAVVVRG